MLKNHFHLLIRVKEETTIRSLTENRSFQNEGLHSIEHIISKQFAKLFSSYTQSFNKIYNRTGSLFETPFKRKQINSDAYLTRTIIYIHQNPQKHSFVTDFKDYTHSSYHSFLSTQQTKLARNEVLQWFGSEKWFIKNHFSIQNENQNFVVEL
ncbi:hypothetical protein [Emticicia oligotrophica]|uniref:hypothetical protein n=1 Tax=Emticicia oligotrophica TaxID=312279 RepID=UPI00273BB5A9|nr:hypothetical protein [Emticicia oligotrophica]